LWFHFLTISLSVMKKGNIVLIFASILFFAFCPLTAKVYHTQIFDNDLHTLRVYNPSQKPHYPIIDLQLNEHIELSFDDLHPSFRHFSYKIIHCNANWTQSDALESEYISGFASGYLQQASPSSNTYVPYTHHSVVFPNEDVRFKLSGNYALLIYLNNDEQQVALTARMYVSENAVGISGSVTGITQIDYKKEHQQVAIEIMPGNFSIHNPQRDLSVVVQQNQRYDNQVSEIYPSQLHATKISYNNERNLIFTGGNEFRNFDLSSTRILSRRIEDISFIDTHYHARLYPDEIRNKAWYTEEYDVNGRFIINVQRTNENDTEADYFYVHFYLPSAPLNEGVYLLGQFNQYHLNEKAEMHYNHKEKRYEKTMLLKQGGYDYAYATRSQTSQTASLKTIEGSYWQTENEYAIYVYYRGFTDQSDRLIGTKIIRTTN
jgi:hypothetical protein